MSSTFVVTYNGFTPQAQSGVSGGGRCLGLANPVERPDSRHRQLDDPGARHPGVGRTRGTFFEIFPAHPTPAPGSPVAVANKLSGIDLAPNDDDIVANFNSSFNWYLGTDGNAGMQFDLMTVVLHELGHGLGFLGSMNGTGGTGYWGGLGYPYVYDRSAINGAWQSLLNTSFVSQPVSGTGGAARQQ